MKDPSKTELNIGALSQASGIPRETIRTWERRYGFPEPRRNEAGHRVYTLEDLEQLCLIGQVLDQGHRAGSVVGQDRESLQALLKTSQALERTAGAVETRGADEVLHSVQESEAFAGPWLSACLDFDRSALERHLHRAWSQLGALACLQERIGPFLQAMGEAWHAGELTVAQEHFTSEVLRDFLVAQWRPLNGAATLPKVVMATLPGESHVLGLHMAAAVVTLGGLAVTFLGGKTPIEDIAQAAESLEALAIAVSISGAYPEEQARRHLDELAHRISPSCVLLVGGGGRPAPAARETHLQDLNELYRWIEARAPRK